MDVEHVVYISVGALSGAWLLLLVFTVHLYCRHRRLQRQLDEIASFGKLRVQKVKMRADSNHAYQNPGITPGEELSRRGYSMYSGDQDLESNHSQAAGPVFIEDLAARNQRQAPPPAFVEDFSRRSQRQAPPPAFVEDFSRRSQRQEPSFPDESARNFRQPPTTAPPFLLNAIETNKRKSLSNPVASGHQPRQTNVRNTNPNFIY